MVHSINQVWFSNPLPFLLHCSSFFGPNSFKLHKAGQEHWIRTCCNMFDVQIGLFKFNLHSSSPFVFHFHKRYRDTWAKPVLTCSLTRLASLLRSIPSTRSDFQILLHIVSADHIFLSFSLFTRAPFHVSCMKRGRNITLDKKSLMLQHVFRPD